MASGAQLRAICGMLRDLHGPRGVFDGGNSWVWRGWSVEVVTSIIVLFCEKKRRSSFAIIMNSGLDRHRAAASPSIKLRCEGDAGARWKAWWRSGDRASALNLIF